MSKENTIYVGMPVTYSNGRDSYPYYVTYVSKDQKKIGLAYAEYTIENCYDGSGTVKPFNPNAETIKYLAKYGNTWYTAHKDIAGNIIRDKGKFARFGYYDFGRAYAYRDPHF
jgi:hypothetical protein